MNNPRKIERTKSECLTLEKDPEIQLDIHRRLQKVERRLEELREAYLDLLEQEDTMEQESEDSEEN